MSHNFELLQRLGFEEQLTTAAPVVEPKHRPVPAPRTAQRTASLRPDPYASGIVQRLYLGAEGTAPQALSFISMERSRNDTLWARVAEHLAAQITGTVCAVDTNFENPIAHKYFNISNDRGLAESLDSIDRIDAFGRRMPGSDLTVIPVGSARPAAMSERLADRVRELREQFDYVILRAPLGAGSADACALGRLTGNAVIVIEAHATRRDAAAHLKLQLEQNGVVVLGAVLNNRTFPIPQSLYSKLF